MYTFIIKDLIYQNFVQNLNITEYLHLHNSTHYDPLKSYKQYETFDQNNEDLTPAGPISHVTDQGFDFIQNSKRELFIAFSIENP